MRPLLLFALLPALAWAQEETQEPGEPRPAYEQSAPAAPGAQELAPGELATIQVADPAAPPAGAPARLDEVVVTAQKVRQPIRRVPLSVTALGGDFIADTGAADLADVSLYVPNVRVDADDLGSPQVFIRGFGTNSFNPSFEAAVSFVQDEIYFGRPGYFTESMFDIDRVEVLRGPQGTLFGKNSVAGVFNVTSRGPEDALGADLRAFGADDGEQRFEGGIGGMFNDWLGGRVAALVRSQDGELRNTLLNRLEEELDQTAARVKGLAYPAPGLKLELTAATSETEAPFWPFQLMKLDDDTRSYLEGFDPQIEDDPTNFITSFETPGWIAKGSDTVGLRTEWDLDELGPVREFVPVLVLGTSTFYIDQLNELDVSPAHLLRLDNHEDHEQLSVELRVSGRLDSLFGLGTGLDFVAGAFWFDSSYTLLARVLAGPDLASYITTDDFAQLAAEDPAAGGAGGVAGGLLGGLGVPTAALTDGDLYRFDYAQDIEATALFGQVTWHLTQNWAITPGLRLNQEKKRVDSAGRSECQGKSLGQPCFLAQLLQTEDYDHDNLVRDETDLSPKLALQYFGDNDINYYASYARGFKSGGFNSISFGRVCEDPDDPASCRPVTGRELEYEPEEAQTWELGTRATFLDRKLGVNLTAYQTDFTNLQVLAFNGVFFDVSNAGVAESRGLELDFQWLTPWDALRLMGSAGLMDAKYKRYPNAPAPVSQGINQNQDLSGRRIAFTPRATATLTPTLSLYFGDFVGTFAVDVLYQGDQYTDTDLDPNTHVPAYTKYAARAMLSRPGGAWTLALGGTNLTDERVLNQVTDAVLFPGTYYAQQASGRQLFAVLTLRI
jgi:iron complex outermembrane recepter protein